MATTKVAITVDQQLLKLIDRWVSQRRYPSRSQAIHAAVREKVERESRARLAEEVTKLNPKEERALAEESPNPPGSGSARFAPSRRNG